jgi:hypothetical protein
MWKDVLIGLVGALLVSWLALVVALVLMRPKGNILRGTLRILPDLRLLKNLATDRTQPKSVRIRLGLLMAYLPSPIDLIPDFVPFSATRTTPSSWSPCSAASYGESASARSASTGLALTTASTPSTEPPASPADQQATRRNHPLDSPGCTAK